MRKTTLWIIALLIISAVFSGCGTGETSGGEAAAPKQGQTTDQRTEVQEDTVQDGKDAQAPSMLTGIFTGFADTNSVEIVVDNEARVFSVDEQIRSDIETLNIKGNDKVKFEIKEMHQGNPLIISIKKVD